MNVVTVDADLAPECNFEVDHLFEDSGNMLDERGNLLSSCLSVIAVSSHGNDRVNAGFIAIRRCILPGLTQSPTIGQTEPLI